jgi:hypothetical protein
MSRPKITIQPDKKIEVMKAIKEWENPRRQAWMMYIRCYLMCWRTRHNWRSSAKKVKCATSAICDFVVRIGLPNYLQKTN